MYGPSAPPSRPLNRSSELRQYAANEWHSNHYQLVLEAERLADEKRKARDQVVKEGRSSLWRFWTSGLKRVSKILARKLRRTVHMR